MFNSEKCNSIFLICSLVSLDMTPSYAGVLKVAKTVCTTSEHKHVVHLSGSLQAGIHVALARSQAPEEKTIADVFPDRTVE